jgi:predicted N-acetyltransferase YhbS
MRIRTAATADLPLFQDIERAAGECFRGIGMTPIAEDEPPGLDELARYQREGRAWTATDGGGRPIAYLIAEPVDAGLHVEQVSVHPDWARRRIGRSLLGRAAEHASLEGLDALTLTAFTEVAWNAPYYARCGFEPVPEAELTPGLRKIREQEAARGLDRWPRVCMRRPLEG